MKNSLKRGENRSKDTERGEKTREKKTLGSKVRPTHKNTMQLSHAFLMAEGSEAARQRGSEAARQQNVFCTKYFSNHRLIFNCSIKALLAQIKPANLDQQEEVVASV